MVFANVLGLVVFLQGRTDRLLAAVVDPLHPDWSGMARAFTGFTVYAASLIGVVGLGILVLAASFLRRTRARGTDRPAATAWRRALPLAALSGGLTGLVVLVFIEVLIFQDYGVHFYEFDVFGILADAALRRDLGIQPAEVARVTAAATTLLGAQLLLCLVAARLARWRNGALARACGAVMLAGVPGGFMLFRAGEMEIMSDRAEFEGALPFGRQLLLRTSGRPYIAVQPRLGAGGYPVLAPGDSAPAITAKKNIVFFVADGLRADMIRPELTPNLLRFGERSSVIHSRRHLSTGHVSEAGIFGLLYGINGHAFHSFMASRVPAYPVEVLRRNGYHTFLLASSRLNPYPSDQLIRVFDQVAYPRDDDEAMVMLARYLDERGRDGRPYFVLAFFYTPHYPFTSAKPHLRRYPSVGPSSRTNYMNDVIQTDDYFRQTFELLEHEYERGKTVVLATSDHGEEIREHGFFGHASATFWNEKIVVPFFLGLPGRTFDPEVRSPRLTSHVDVWPTILEYLGAEPGGNESRFSDGHSLLHALSPGRYAYVPGRFFPYADRPSAVEDGKTKYWFRVTGVSEGGELCIQITRVTDLDDRVLPVDAWRLGADSVPALRRFQSEFWRFLRHSGATSAMCPARKLQP